MFLKPFLNNMSRLRAMAESDFLSVILLGIISVFYTGYVFISNDLVFANGIRQLKDPLFLANDITFDAHPRSILFFRLLSCLSDILPINILFFIFYFIKNILLCGGIYKLAYCLTKNRTAAFISIAAIFYTANQKIPLSFDIVLNSFSFSSFAVAICFFAIAFFIEKRHFLCFIILGVGINIHLIICSQVLAVLLIYYCLMNWREIRWKEILPGLFICLCLASPEIINVLSIALQEFKESSVSFKEYLEIFGYMRGPHHHFPEAWSFEKYLRFAAFSLAGIYAYLNLQKSRESASGIWMCLIIVCLCVASIPFTHRFMPVLIYQPFRMTIWIYAIMLIFICGFIAETLQSKTDKKSYLWAFGAMAFINSIFLLCVLFLLRVAHDWRLERKKIKLAFLILFALLILIFLTLKHPQYPLFIFPALSAMLRTPYQATDIYLLFLVVGMGVFGLFFKLRQAFYSWTRNNTEKDAIFIYPPYYNGNPFRYYAERPVLADFTMVAFSKNATKEWFKRLDALSNHQLSNNFKDIIRKKDFSYSIEVLRKGFLTLGAQDFRNICREFKCSYVITESNNKITSLCPVYEDLNYNVYKLN